MLSYNGLKQAMMNATLNHTNAFTAQNLLGIAIRDYIIANALLNFTWTDDFPHSTTPTGNILTCPINLTPNNTDSHINGLQHLADQIVDGIRLGLFNITEGGYSTTAQLMSDCPSFSLSIDGTNVRDSAFDQIATQIVDQIWAYHPANIISGTHSGHTGASTSTTIT